MGYSPGCSESDVTERLSFLFLVVLTIHTHSSGCTERIALGQGQKKVSGGRVHWQLS